MRTLLFIIALSFVSCHQKGAVKSFKVAKFIPDSTKSFYAKQLYQDYRRTRRIETILNLPVISEGSEKTELRYWDLSSSFDPQSIYSLKKIGSNEWKLSVIKYYASSRDSIASNINMTFPNDLIARLNIDKFWTLNSQSEMYNGDSFGCMDGNTVLLELSDASTYKYILFRCPEIHAARDSAFYNVAKLSGDLSALAKE